MSSALGTNWICVRTQPRREQWAKINIERTGLKVVLPMLREKILGVERTRPLFPSYLFTQILRGQWYFLFSTFGVSGPIMRGGEHPEVVPTPVVEDLLHHLDAQGCYRTVRRLAYRRGQKLDIKHGPFRGLVGTYDGMSPQERVRVLLDLFGRSVVASVSVEDVSVQACT
jgi:transcriptional antiterminator RfaH